MKILITEKQAEKLLGEKIKCRCSHSWVKEKKDQYPYLCNMCGWDQEHEKYNDKQLLNFWKKELDSN